MDDRQAELRPITALFLDFVESTDLQTRMGAERTKRALDRAFAEIRDIITNEGGTVEKYVGDAIFAIFGAPRSHEDDPLRALRAARESLGWAERTRDRAAWMAVRVGIETGEAVVDVHGASFEHQQMAVGRCVNAAARLQGMAAPGTIFVGPVCRRIAAAAAEFADLGEMELKGLGPQRVWQLTSVKAFPTRAQPLFVGRDSELGSLSRALRRARERPELVLISGPPGQGKTRLVEEFVRKVGPEIRLLSARCRPAGEVGSMNPLRELLIAEDADDSLRLRERCEDLVGEPVAATRMANTLAHSAGIKPSSELTALRALEREDEIASGWRRFLGALAREKPLVIWLEDLHWAEEEIVSLIHRIVVGGHGAVLIIGTARREFSIQSGPGTGGVSRVIDLGPLPDEDAAALALAAGAGVTAQAVKAEGNPLFIIELARSRHTNLDELPMTLGSLIGARLDELESEDRELLQFAAVAGETFSVTDVAVLSGREDAVIASGLDRLVDRLYLRRAAPGYRFHHALLRDVAYQRLPVTQRMRLHAGYARNGVSAEDSEAAAYHWWKALRPPDAEWVWEGAADFEAMRADAVRVMITAGTQQLQRSASSRALETLARALELARTAQERARVHAALADAHRFEIAGDEAWKHYAMAASAYEEFRVSPPADLYASMVELPAYWPNSFRTSPPRDEIETFLHEGEAVARKDDNTLALARILLAGASVRAGQVGEYSGTQDIEEAEAILSGHEREPGALDVLETIGAVYFNANDATSVGRIYDRVDQFVSQGAHVTNTDMFFSSRITWLVWARADLSKARELVDRYEAATAVGGAHLKSHALGASSWLAFSEGNLDRVLQLANAGRALVRDNPTTTFCPAGAVAASLLASHALALRGEYADAEEMLVEAKRFERGQEDQDVLAYALLGRAEDRDRLLEKPDTWRDWGFLALTAAVSGRRWDLIDQRSAALRQQYASGFRMWAAILDAAVEEREHARGGPVPSHLHLRSLGAIGWSLALAAKVPSDAM